MEEGYVEINSVPTRVITMGGWINKGRTVSKKHLIIVIPGKCHNKKITYFVWWQFKVYVWFSQAIQD